MKESFSFFYILNILLMIFICLCTLYPFLYTLAVSLSDEISILSGQVYIIPKGLNIEAYKMVFKHQQFWRMYFNTVLYTFVGTAISLALTTMAAYALSKKKLKGRNIIQGIMIFTMFYSGGMIPSYLLMKELRLIDTIWAIVLPGAISVYNLIVMRSFFQSFPEELEEASYIDGLNPFGTLLKIVIPLSKAILATMCLFYAVAKWNEWFNAFLYINDPNKMPVTIFLRNIIEGARIAAQEGTQEESAINERTMRSASIMIVSIPIICIYPFVQKHFVKGVMIGSLKG